MVQIALIAATAFLVANGQDNWAVFFAFILLFSSVEA